MFLDITTYTTGKLDELTNTFIPGPGFPWSALYHPIPAQVQPLYADGTRADIPPPVYSFYFLLLNMVVYSVLTLYFDRVIPDEYGTRLSPWFFLKKQFWGWREPKEKNAYQDKVWIDKMKKELGLAESDPREDVAVTQERHSVLDVDNPSPVKLFGLSKMYRFSILSHVGIHSPQDRYALRQLFLSFQKGKLLALLGQNGAGKTTVMNILSGLTPPSSGDALLCGYSVRSQMHRIRKILGVCPQHDILFEELTAREHIYLYAGLKNVPRSTWQKLIIDRLGAVKLDKVADHRVCTFSGGWVFYYCSARNRICALPTLNRMRRRLSLVISTIGDPEIMFLDEPTTGMDPVNRRHVWSFIEQFKVNRTIVLTTHSMEEADVLGDRIAIMAHGQLCAIGTSMQLKTRFGNGYRVSIVTDHERLQEAKDFVDSRAPTAILTDDSAGALVYQFPAHNIDAVPSFVRHLDEEDSGLIRNWGLSQTSLEEVFLRLMREAKPVRGYRGDPEFTFDSKTKDS
jgi:ABC-type multidrug transport system ATPase subunit